jgi:hypothetical protein
MWSYLLQALFEFTIGYGMLDPTGRKALVCQGIPELTSKLHAGSSHAHVSSAVNPKRWFRAETTATRGEEHGGRL